MIYRKEIKISEGHQQKGFSFFHEELSDLFYNSISSFSYSVFHPLNNVSTPSSLRNNYPVSHLDLKESGFMLHTGNSSTEVCCNTHEGMNTDVFDPDESDIFQLMASFQCRKESFNSGSVLIDFGKRWTETYGFEYVLSRPILLEIESRAIGSLPTFLFEDTRTTFFFIQSTTEFNSLSLGFSSIVTEGNTCLTEELSFWTDSDGSPVYGILSGSWILSDVGSNLFIEKKRSIGGTVISGISEQCSNGFTLHGDHFNRIFGQWCQLISIPFIGWSDCDSRGDREIGVGHFDMNFVTEEYKIFGFISPLSITIGLKRFDMRRIHTEFEFFGSDQSETLGNEVEYDLMEEFGSEFLTEIMEGIMLGSLTITETAEISQTSIESKLFGYVSFRRCKTKINKQNSLEKTNRIITLSTIIGITVFGNGMDMRKIHGFEEDIKGIIFRNQFGYFDVNKTVLFCGFHWIISQNDDFLTKSNYINKLR